MNVTNVFSNLTGSASSEQMAPSRPVATVLDDSLPKLIRTAEVCVDGVLLQCRGARAFVPLAELWRLAESTDDRFKGRTLDLPSGPSAFIRKRAAEIRKRNTKRRKR
jgi:hypothetical protein